MRFTQCFLACGDSYLSSLFTGVFSVLRLKKTSPSLSLIWMVATFRTAQLDTQHKRTAPIKLCRLIENDTTQVALYISWTQLLLLLANMKWQTRVPCFVYACLGLIHIFHNVEGGGWPSSYLFIRGNVQTDP